MTRNVVMMVVIIVVTTSMTAGSSNDVVIITMKVRITIIASPLFISYLPHAAFKRNVSTTCMVIYTQNRK